MTAERTTAIGLLALCCAFGTGAEEQAPAATVIGATTEAILQMQRDGAAAGRAQPIAGEVASRSYKRYLESFTRPIPEPERTTGSAAKPAGAGNLQ